VGIPGSLQKEEYEARRGNDKALQDYIDVNSISIDD
jgi:hypothetical protein